MPLTQENLHDAFQHQPVDDDQKARMEKIRETGEAFARAIMENAPACADTSTALRKAREARKDANEAIALKGLV